MSYVYARFNKGELSSLLKACSSIKKIIPSKYGDVIVWDEKAILDQSGNPVPLKHFMELTGQRKIQIPPDFSKTDEEKQNIKVYKSQWKKSMKNAFGKDWKKLSRKLNYFNHPTNDKGKEQLNKILSSL